MRRTFGLTALLLLTVAVLAVAGCTGSANSGAGLIQPFATGSHTGNPTSSPTASPTLTPFPTGTATVLPSRQNPTRMTLDSSTMSIFMVEGFNQGVGQGRLVRFRLDTEDGVSESDPDTPQTFTIEQAQGKTGLAATAINLTNPVWIDSGMHPITGKYFLVITENFGTNQGRVLVLEPELDATGYTGKALATDLGALASSAPINPLACCFDGKYVWWTEYTGLPQGRVRRADLSQDPPVVVDYMVGLDFPAGIDSNGGYVAFAQNGAGTYVVGPTVPDPATYPVPLADAYTLTEALGDPVMVRPFDVMWTAGTTLVGLDGFGLSVAGGPGPAGPGLGNLRFFTGPGDQNFSNRTLNLVKGDLTEPVGLGVFYDAVADDSVKRLDVAFTESKVTTGTVRHVGFQTVKPFDLKVDEILINNFTRGFHALPLGLTVSPSGVPPVTVPLPKDFLLFLTQGFDMGVANGSVIRYYGPSQP